MSIKIPSLTRTGLESLKDTVRRSRREPYKDSFCCDDKLQPNPDLYIAKVPYDGIPAAQKFAGNELGGRVQCELFTLQFTGNNPDQNPVISPLVIGTDNNNQPIPFTAWVYNYHNWKAYGKVFGANRNLFVEVRRAKSGQWVVERPQQMLKCKPVNDIGPGVLDQVAIWLQGNDFGGVDSGQTEYARNNWKNDGTRIAKAGTEQWIFFCPDEGPTGQWVFVFDNPIQQQSGIPFYDDDAITMPAYAVMWNSDASIVIGGTRYLKARRPSSSFNNYWLVNESVDIASGSTGNCDLLHDKVAPVLIDPSLAGTILSGMELGPKTGSFSLWPNRPGFTAISDDYTIGGINVVDCKQRVVTRVYGRLYNDLTQNADGNATAEMEIWFRNLSTDGKRYFSGWDKITVYAPLMLKGDKAKVNTFCYADYMMGFNGWEADPACDPDNTNSTQGSQQTTGGSQILTGGYVPSGQTF